MSGHLQGQCLGSWDTLNLYKDPVEKEWQDEE